MSKSSATKLPSQVQKIGQASEAMAVETGIKPGSKPVETASSQLAAVQNTAEPAKVDPDDYKTRYSNYKKATDTTISELRQTLATTQATLSETQRQVQDLLSAQSNTGGSAAPATVETQSTAGTKDDPAYKAYLDKLPDSVKNEYTEDYLFDQFLIQTAAGSAGNSQSEGLEELNNKVNSVVQFQEKTQAELYEEAMDSAFPNDEWITLANGPEWSVFCAQAVSAVDPRTYGQIVKEGSDSHTATTVTWVLNQYKQHLSTLEAGNTSGNSALESQLTPEGSAGGNGDPIAEINAATESFTQSQVTQFFTDVATSKKYSAEDAAAIEKKIMAAQAAGKILQG